MEPTPKTIMDLIHDASCCHQPLENSILRGAVERLDQKTIDEWRAENRSSAVFGSSSPELEDLSKMFDD